MEREPVDSICLRSAGFEDGELELEFTDGRVYTYHSVSGHQFSRMLRSPSPGYYFNKYIRDNYSFSEG